MACGARRRRLGDGTSARDPVGVDLSDVELGWTSATSKEGGACTRSGSSAAGSPQPARDQLSGLLGVPARDDQPVEVRATRLDHDCG